jgi:type III secretion protein T
VTLQLLSTLLNPLSDHLVALGLISLRIVPMAFLCPVLGGWQAPSVVRLGLVFSMAGAIHVEGGIGFEEKFWDPWTLAGAGLRELLFGLVLGLMAAVPFDVARMSGRWIDTFRGTSAEASLPWIGTHEAATGELLHRWLTAVCAGGVGWSVLVHGIWKSFLLVTLGTRPETSAWVQTVCRILTGLFSLSLAIGAPIAAACLMSDALFAVLGRVAARMPLRELMSPLKILGGAALLWLCAGAISHRLVDSLAAFESELVTLQRATP